jgi:hypothetical protein
MGTADNGAFTLSPPHLAGWTAYCEDCDGNRPFALHKERDVETGAGYFEYVCDVCAGILLTLTPPTLRESSERANPL